MRPAPRTVRALACAAAVALAPACRQAGAPPPPVVVERPPSDWPIDHTRRTDDPAKSELLVRASQALQAGDAAGAEALYRQAIARFPTDPDWYEALGACLYFQGRYDEARAEYHRALQLNQRSADALYGLGCVARKQKRSADAIQFLEQALAVREEFALCHHELADLYDEQGDPEKALRHYERAAALDPAIAEDEDVQRRIAELKG